MTCADLVLRKGRIIDPANNLDFIGDIVIINGIIQTVGIDLKVEAITEFNATGCLVTPCLIDCHVHCYEYATPLGINPDERCLSRGVTTVVDAGSSGESTFNGLNKYKGLVFSPYCTAWTSCIWRIFNCIIVCIIATSTSVRKVEERSNWLKCFQHFIKQPMKTSLFENEDFGMNEPTDDVARN